MSKARSAGFSPARLKRIESFLEQRYLASGRFPNALTLIARHGEIAYLSVQGLADVERGKPLAEDAIFRIFSMTKPITSVALMMLVEEGAVALDDPVSAFIPAWRDLGVYVSGGPGAFVTRAPERPMRIIDLLRHTSGLTYGFQNRTPVDAAYRAAGVGGSQGGMA
ncbi:MAG: serine hydrolase domain-containing protein, partial [Caulobacteraceae bacterium]